MRNANIMNTLRERIKERKYKFTRQRQIVLQAFLDSKDNHLSAEEVFAMVKDEDPDIGLATIYRSLELFTSLELLKKLDFGDGRSRYELSDHSLEMSHHHLICLGCGKVIEFSGDYLNGLKEKIEEDDDFEIVDSQLKVYGYCRECREKNVK